MKVLVDTSILVAAVVQKHVHHARAFQVLERAQNGKDEGYVSAHSLAEMYAVLTKLPPPYRHTPEEAILSIEENVVKYFKLTSLTGTEYAALIREAALSGIQGGTIYDALVLRCAGKSDVAKVFTLNLKHFQSIAPNEFSAEISTP